MALADGQDPRIAGISSAILVILSNRTSGHNAGIEARGFIFGPSFALAIGATCIPLRKPNKLPGAVQPGERALVIGDLIATGGTLSAAIKLLERVGYMWLSVLA